MKKGGNMDISIFKELKEFEVEQEILLEDKKKKLIEEMRAKKKEVLDMKKKELLYIESKKGEIMKLAEEKAKAEAVSDINSFKEKTTRIEEQSKDRVEQAMYMIFNEFLNQDV
jgi:hypothetical protein